MAKNANARAASEGVKAGPVINLALPKRLQVKSCHRLRNHNGQTMTDKLTLAVNHALNDVRLARARMGMLANNGAGQ